MRVQSIKKSFPGGIVAVRDAELNLPEAKVVVLLGPNGSGKSTLLHCLSGAIRPEAGVLVDSNGKLHDLRSTPRGLRRGVICVYQSPRLFSRLTTLENCLMAIPGWGFDGKWTQASRKHDLEARIRKALCRFGIEDYASTTAGELSTGCARRLEFARMVTACEFGARLCLLDEPSTGLDPEGFVLLRELLVGLRAQNCHVLLVEHNLEVATWADDSYLLVEGEVIAHAPPGPLIRDDLFKNAMLQVPWENSNA